MWMNHRGNGRKKQLQRACGGGVGGGVAAAEGLLGRGPGESKEREQWVVAAAAAVVVAAVVATLAAALAVGRVAGQLAEI